jgi:hypothetical protein
MIGSADAERVDGQRRAPRHRALLGGKLMYGGGYFTLDCLVRDLSALGARLKLPEGQAVPPEVFFLELRSGVAHQARVVWRRHPEIGLEFTASFPLDSANHPDLQVLKKLWTESRERPGL